jgi:protein-arginine kinase activator protein McsA
VPLKCPACDYEMQQATARPEDDPMLACSSCNMTFESERDQSACAAPGQTDRLDWLFDD